MRKVVLCVVFLSKIFVCYSQVSADEFKKMRKNELTNYADH